MSEQADSPYCLGRFNVPPPRLSDLEQNLLEALESLLIYGDVYASGADGQSPYGRALKAVAKAKGVKE